MHVVLVSDAAYLPWCATAIASCARVCAGLDLTAHVVHALDVSSDDQHRLRSLGARLGAAVELHAVDEDAVSMLPTKGPALGGRMSWVRVLLADLLPSVDRVVYLDADTLVVDSIVPLWDLELDGAALAGVPNVTEPAMRPHVASLGIEDPADYLNAGVLVLDLAQWRETAAGKELIGYVTGRSEPLPWFDQDALNVVFAGRSKRLHARWNAMNSLWVWRDYATEILGAEEVEEATTSPAVLHFEGPSISKPWHYLSDHPWRPEYRKTLARTPWASTPLEDRTLATRLIARLPAPRRLPAYARLHQARARTTAIRERLAAARLDPGSIGRSVKPSSFARRIAGRRRGRPLGSIDEPRSDAEATGDGLSEAERAIIDQVRPFTMTSRERIVSVLDATAHVVRRDIPGAFVECGVWRGGSVLAMILTLQRLGVGDRDVYLFDTFDGMTRPTDADTTDGDEPAMETWERARAEGTRAWDWAFGTHVFGYEQVQELLIGSGYPRERLHFVKGPVEETIPGVAPAAIALLRLDTDWYESTRHELVHLYPRLATGGVLIIDDYGHWHGARLAVDEYFAAEAEPLLLGRVDYTGRMGVKS